MAKETAQYEAPITDPTHGLTTPATAAEVAAGGFVILAMPVGVVDQLLTPEILAEYIGADEWVGDYDTAAVGKALRVGQAVTRGGTIYLCNTAHLATVSFVAGNFDAITGTGDLSASDIDTLAELNAILTDAVLIDTNDARLSDARTPTAHTHVMADITDLVAGDLSASDIDTLAELNGILTDAVLIDTNDARLSDARTPTAHTHVAADVTDLPSVKQVTSNGAVITYSGPAGGTAPTFVSAAGSATLSPNGNTILSVVFTETPSGSFDFAFTHNVGSPPQYTTWRDSTGIEEPGTNSVIDPGENILTVNGYGTVSGYRHRFNW